MATSYDVSVFIGRCQPVHQGHLALLMQALAAAPRVVVVLGSAHRARSPKNPFTWTERAELVRLALPEAARERVSFVPVRDYFDMGRWVAAVRGAVETEAARVSGLKSPRIALVGHHKDLSSSYLNAFSGWSSVSLPRLAGTDAVHLRNAYFSGAGQHLDGTLAALSTEVPASTLGFLRAFAALPAFRHIAEEWKALAEYKRAWSSAPYAPVFVTVDTVVECCGHVLLIRRGQAPGKGLWALPGGFLEPHDTILASALRELHEETGVALDDDALLAGLKHAQVFDHPDRSLRGRTVTHAFHFELPLQAVPTLEAGDDASDAAWVARQALPAMEAEFHDDHFHILERMLGLPLEPVTRLDGAEHGGGSSEASAPVGLRS
jgi:bifunctional NMN adenylyltransferase/nudix hydrolase